jgi:REP-associated tyrosine transposase
MRLSHVGEYAHKCWKAIPNHFPHFYLDEFVVMPNHVHGIIVIDRPVAGNTVNNAVETGHALSLHHIIASAVPVYAMLCLSRNF